MKVSLPVFLLVFVVETSTPPPVRSGNRGKGVKHGKRKASLRINESGRATVSEECVFADLVIIRHRRSPSPLSCVSSAYYIPIRANIWARGLFWVWSPPPPPLSLEVSVKPASNSQEKLRRK